MIVVSARDILQSKYNDRTVLAVNIRRTRLFDVSQIRQTIEEQPISNPVCSLSKLMLKKREEASELQPTCEEN